MQLSGIYCIENLISGKNYIGQTIDIKKRKYQHLSNLRRNRHHNPYLQNAYNKYGEDSFEFKVLLYCNPNELTKYEQFYVDYYGSKKLYNICKECVDSTLGIKLSAETKQKISKATSGENNPMYGKSGNLAPNYGKHPDSETRKKLSVARLGKNNGMVYDSHYNFGNKSKNSSSKYYGVSLSDKKYKYWSARVSINGRKYFIGKYKSEIEAAMEYDKYIIKNNLKNPLNFLQN